jgi:outer membrane protein assembly factor BamB
MRPVVLRSAALAAVVFLLTGCSTFDKLNPFSSSKAKSKVSELTPIQTTADLRLLWQAKVGGAGDYVFTPAVVGDSVYAAGHDGTIARFDAGREIWRISAGQQLSGGVGADAKVAVVGTAKGDVLAFDAQTGKAEWQARVSSEVLAAPAVGDGLVVVRSGDSRIAGLDAADGKRHWVYQRATPALSLRSNVGVLLADHVVVAGFPGGKLVAINSQNGAALWEVTVALPKGSTELERVADLTSTPVVDGREICAAAFQGRVSCYDMRTGNLAWGRDISSSAGLDMDGGRVYVSDDKGIVHAFSRDGGASLWQQEKLAGRNLSRPLALGRQVALADFSGVAGKSAGLDGKLVGQHVAVADLQGVVHLLNAGDGGFAARFNTDGSAVLAELVRIKDGFVVQTRNGGLFALGGR